MRERTERERGRGCRGGLEKVATIVRTHANQSAAGATRPQGVAVSDYFVPAPAAATAMIGALVGCGAPPAASSVTATALSESRASAYVARTTASPRRGSNVPALILAPAAVTSHSW